MPGLAGDPTRLPMELGKLAHDLRSALSASMAYLDLVREQLEEGAPSPLEDLDRMERSLQRVEMCVERIEVLRKEVTP